MAGALGRGGRAVPGVADGAALPSQRARSQNIVPCTVSQLLAAEQVEETFRIRDVEISQVGVGGGPRGDRRGPAGRL